ncbi:MAG: MaoC/PaaZ C-terminal domain-containing protein [Acidimicrobiia bacterium]
MDVASLEGQSFGPRPMHVAAIAVADFMAAIGDDPERWKDAAPPGFAAAALFAVAPDLLDQVSDRFVVHGEQTFSWHSPIKIGSQLEVTGTVSRIRERGGAHFVIFDTEATEEDEPVLRGSSTFVLSGEWIPAHADFERPEPPHGFRGDPDPGQVAVSRAQLVRYAAATRDWNPIHWDHDAAVAAGFPGVVVHGLLQAAWAFAAVSDDVLRPRPLHSAKVRFRNPLLPARPADVGVEVEKDMATVTIADADTQYLTAQIRLSHG